MKKSILLLIILMLSELYYLKSENFNLMPINIHFYGSVSTSKSIIAYGDYGAYLMTTDKGKNWKQYSINDYGNIQLMINKNDTLWAIIDEGILLRSTDHGMNWNKRRYSLDSGVYFIIVAHNGVQDCIQIMVNK